MAVGNPYRGAYPWLPSRHGVWREIAAYVAADAPRAGSLLELVPGYCDFVNAFPASRKFAFDLNPDMKLYARPEVDFRSGDCLGLPGFAEESLDLVFASNFLEHFSLAAVASLLSDIHRVLGKGGRLILIQPNYLRCGSRYWDDPTHKTLFHDGNIGSFLARGGFRLVKLIPGLLPFSMKSRFPKIPILVRAYLRSPIRPWAAQMYVVAEKE